MKKTVASVFIVLVLISTAFASFHYEIEWQKEILEVGPQGKVMLNKSFSFKVLPESTEQGTEVWVGLPTKGTSVSNAMYFKNGMYTSMDYKIKRSDSSQHIIFQDFPAISPGESLVFEFYAEIPDLIYWLDKDQLDKELKDQLVSLSYIPAWWDKAETKDLIVEFRFAPKLDVNKITYLHNEPVVKEQQYNVAKAIYHYQDLAPNSKMQHAIILPKGYFSEGFEPKKDWLSSGAITAIVASVLGVCALLIALISLAVQQARYQTPAAYITGKEALTTFDPVEAALFFNVPGDLLVKMIIMGLMDKKVIKLDANNNLKRESTLERLTWYEDRFLDVIDDKVNVKKDKWPMFSQEMVSKLKELLGGYCGAQTKAYYTKFLKDELDQDDDPRWFVLKDYLERKIPSKAVVDSGYEPSFSSIYIPLFYLHFIDNDMEKERRAAYSSGFASTASKGSSSGPSCACACACACASSGGCT